MNTENKLKIDDFTKALAECINQAQCAVVDPMAHAEIWKNELLELANGKEPISEIDFEQELYKYFGQVEDFALGMRIAKRFYEIGRNHQEPISEDLEKAAKECAFNLQLQEYFKKGAQWKEKQMEAYRIEHCKSLTNEQAELEEYFVLSHVEKNNRIPTFIDAIEYGMEYCKQQMMAKAVDVTIAIPYPNGYGGYTQLVDSQEALPFGENIKVLVIKED